MAEGPQAGLDMVDRLSKEPALESYYLLPSIRGDFLKRLGRNREARIEFLRAADIATNDRERAFLKRRAEEALN
jgi:predicted RNA polymerase sigma factor